MDGEGSFQTPDVGADRPYRASVRRDEALGEVDAVDAGRSAASEKEGLDGMGEAALRALCYNLADIAAGWARSKARDSKEPEPTRRS
jgi:hypothetical protein